MHYRILFRQAFVWGMGAQLGAQLVVGTINLTQTVFGWNKKDNTPEA